MHMANFYLRTYIWIYIESIFAKFWNLRTAASDYSFILVIYLFSAVSLQLWKSLWRVVRKRSPVAAALPGPATLLKKSLISQRQLFSWEFAKFWRKFFIWNLRWLLLKSNIDTQIPELWISWHECLSCVKSENAYNMD